MFRREMECSEYFTLNHVSLSRLNKTHIKKIKAFIIPLHYVNESEYLTRENQDGTLVKKKSVFAVNR